jgi:hypothetical protein
MFTRIKIQQLLHAWTLNPHKVPQKEFKKKTHGTFINCSRLEIELFKSLGDLFMPVRLFDLDLTNSRGRDLGLDEDDDEALLCRCIRVGSTSGIFAITANKDRTTMTKKNNYPTL